MTFDADNIDNFTTNGFDGYYSDGYEREDFPLINLYLALPLRIIISLAIIISASIVLLAIRDPLTVYVFFFANLIIADILVAVIYNGAAILNMILASMRKGMDCRIIAVTVFPAAADSMMLAALCFDRLYSVIAPHHYRRNMTKRKGYVIASAIWLISLLLGFLSLTDSHLNSTKTKDVICDDSLGNDLGIVVIILPSILSALFVLIESIYLNCIVVITTTRSDTNNSSMTVVEALGTLKETNKIYKSIFILSLTSITLGSLYLEESRTQVGYKDIWFELIPFIYSLSIFLHFGLFK